jgi:hypothetical protein
MKAVKPTMAIIFLLVSGVSVSADARVRGARVDQGDTAQEKEQAVQVNEKVMRKISMGIGEEVGQFSVTQQEQAEAAAGSKATQYTIKSNAGRIYKCQIIEPSRFGKILSLGTAASADALCTEFSGPAGGRTGAKRTSGTGNGAAGAAPKDRAAIPVDPKVAKKISMAIGEETDDFVVTGQDAVDASVGMKGTDYTVRTSSGKTFKCQILEPSRLGKIVTFGTVGSADALCTDFTKGSKDRGKTNQASCNALLRAARKCE